MKKIMILGNAGNGKTTLSNQLSQILGIEVFHLDSLLYKPGWQRTSHEYFFKKYSFIMQQDSWILDGWGYLETLNSRIEEADKVIFIDLPIWLSCWRAFKRQIVYAFKSRPEFPANCPNLPKSIELINSILYVHRKLRPKIFIMMNKMENQKFVYLTTPKDVEEYLRSI